MTKHRNQGFLGYYASGGGAGGFGLNDMFIARAFPIPNQIEAKRKNVIEPRVGVMQASLLGLMRHFRKSI